MRVALATCRPLPEPDPDEPLLLDALRARGADPVLAAWDDPDVDWRSFDLTVVRSTWNYHLAPDAFLRWIDRAPRLVNPAAALRWNVHKRYLADLEARGVPVVPTAHLPRGDARRLADFPWDTAVIKPAISAGSFETIRVGPADRARGDAHLARLLAGRDVLVQPYLASVERRGERALVWIDGAWTHAVRKNPRFGADAESVSPALPIDPDERAFADRVLAAAPRGLLYARVDLALDDAGALRLMELELIEPSLFLLQFPPALNRLADAIVRV